MPVKARLESWLSARWYAPLPPPLPLRPLAALYGAVAQARRHRLSASATRLPVPVIVVGNLSVGGTGKTPFTLWLVEQLREWGWHPGIVSRGYGGHAPYYPFRVAADSDAAHVGDEPLMMMRRLLCPLFVGPDRVAAARALIAESDVDIVIADDGLQHYALARDLEICVVDGVRGLGNGALLPAGPLRELPPRLHEVQLTVVNGGDWQAPAAPSLRMELAVDVAHPLTGGPARSLKNFSGRVHAVAGIGNPERFFRALRRPGLQVITHAFPDHHQFTAADLDFGDDAPVLMTEKDAVKCQAFAVPRLWVVPAQAQIPEAGAALVRKLLADLRPE